MKARHTNPIVGVLFTVACVAGVADLRAQDRRHPTEMGLGQAQIEMPDTNRTRLILENGMIGFVVPDNAAPVVTFTAFVRGGRADDQSQGAAEMLRMMMVQQGPCWLGPGRFEETLTELDAVFYVAMGVEMTEISMNVAAADAEAALRIFSGIVREPCIDEEGLTAFRERLTSETETVSEVAGSLDDAVDVFNDLLFAEHEYRTPVTVQDGEALQLEDVDRFHREFFTPSNVVLAVSGDFELMAMARLIDQRFADWQPRRPPGFSRADGVSTPEPAETTRIEVDKLQTWIVVGHELPPLEPRDLVPVQVMNYILGGGHFDTRLFREARDRRGLTNDASGFVEPGLRGPGSYTFRTYGRPEVAEELVDVVFSEIRRIQNEPVTEEELAVAKGALTDGVFALLFENGHTTARTFAFEWARFVTFDHLARYRDWVEDVSIRDIQRAAQRYLHPDRMRVVMVGPSTQSGERK